MRFGVWRHYVIRHGSGRVVYPFLWLSLVCSRFLSILQCTWVKIWVLYACHCVVFWTVYSLVECSLEFTFEPAHSIQIEWMSSKVNQCIDVSQCARCWVRQSTCTFGTLKHDHVYCKKVWLITFQSRADYDYQSGLCYSSCLISSIKLHSFKIICHVWWNVA